MAIRNIFTKTVCLSFSLAILLNCTTSAQPISWAEIDIDQSFGWPNALAVGDVNGDGSPDLVAGSQSSEGIAWWQNKDGTQFAQQEIVGGLKIRRVLAVDFDGDLDLDVIGGAATTQTADLSWYENDGGGNFTKHTIALDGELIGNERETFFISLDVADVNDDGVLDIVSTTKGTLIWWENAGNGLTFSRHVVVSGVSSFAVVHTADIDKDSDIDFFTGSFKNPQLKWWQNDGHANFTQTAINSDRTNLEMIEAIVTGDIDKDGDLDVAASAFEGGRVAWFENDGAEHFTRHDMPGTYEHARWIRVTDLDKDGDLDIIGTTSSPDNRVFFCENDGSQNFLVHTVSSNFESGQDVAAVDLDLDGDLDIVGVGLSGGVRAWLSNLSDDPSTNIDEADGVVTQSYSLEQNYPNPFNPKTEIEFYVPSASNIQLVVYDLSGRLVSVLIEGWALVGTHTVRWDGKDYHGNKVVSGVYFYRLKAGNFYQVRKMTLLQ